MPGSEFSSEFRFGVQPSGCTDFEQAKACTPCLVWSSAQSSGLEFSLQAALTLKQAKACTPCLVRSSAQSSGFGVQPSGCTDLEPAKACTPCLVRNSAQSSGLEFSLQAALTLSRLKPVLHASESVALLRPGHYPERP